MTKHSHCTCACSYMYKHTDMYMYNVKYFELHVLLKSVCCQWDFATYKGILFSSFEKIKTFYNNVGWNLKELKCFNPQQLHMYYTKYSTWIRYCMCSLDCNKKPNDLHVKILYILVIEVFHDYQRVHIYSQLCNTLFCKITWHLFLCKNIIVQHCQYLNNCLKKRTLSPKKKKKRNKKKNFKKSL